MSFVLSFLMTLHNDYVLVLTQMLDNAGGFLYRLISYILRAKKKQRNRVLEPSSSGQCSPATRTSRPTTREITKEALTHQRALPSPKLSERYQNFCSCSTKINNPKSNHLVTQNFSNDFSTQIQTQQQRFNPFIHVQQQLKNELLTKFCILFQSPIC